VDGLDVDAPPWHVRLGDGRWWLWRDIALRGAGFPADYLSAVCDSELTSAVDASRLDQKAWDTAVTRLSARTAEVAADPLFREAVAWQNPKAVATCLDKVTDGRPRNAKRRAHEVMVAAYLQRYCLKNDTIGFFGPVGWATAEPDEPVLSVTPGDGLLRRRTTYFETWAVDELARALAGQEKMSRWLAPRPVAANVLVGQVLYRSRGRPVQLSDVEARLLARCDGTRPVADLLDQPDAAEVLRRLTELGAIRLDLLGPVEAWPERTLRSRLTLVRDEAVRTRAYGLLDEMAAARAGLAAAAGDTDAVLAAWETLGEVFARITGEAPQRRAGRTYAGRTLCYEDTIRDVGVRVGAAVLDALASPLTLVLDSARWLVAEVGERYRRVFTDLYERERARVGDSALPLGRLLVMATPELPSRDTGILTDLVAGAVAEFQRRWAAILAVPPGEQRHHVDAAAIAPDVARLFPVRQVPWSAATQHSPDILIAGPLDDPLLVLGELHMAVNTLESRFLVEQHEDRLRLLAAAEADHGDRRIYLLPRRDGPFVTSRTLPPSALLSPRYTYVALDVESAAVPGPVIPLADLVAERQGGAVVARSRTSGAVLDLMEVFGELLSSAVVNAFQPVADAGHRPRVTIDRFVLCREAWRFSAAETDWAFRGSQRERFTLARRWQIRHGIPGQAFYRVPGEDKPRAVDFRSPALVDLLAKAIRATETFSVVEMLPDVSRLWLHDNEGRRYTSELRFVAVDPVLVRDRLPA
jgi:hypothetical protein